MAGEPLELSAKLERIADYERGVRATWVHRRAVDGEAAEDVSVGAGRGGVAFAMRLRVVIAARSLSWACAFVAATLGVGCGTPSGTASDAGPAGPTFCAENVGPVPSCEVTATTGPVSLCGPQFPRCSPPSQTGDGVWGCCAAPIVSGSVEETACTFAAGGSGDATCPCAGCGDSGQ